jgi:hypothetical protein
MLRQLSDISRRWPLFLHRHFRIFSCFSAIEFRRQLSFASFRQT